METPETISKPVWWAGTILKGLVVLFFLADAGMKVIKHPISVEGTVNIGLPESSVQMIGAILLTGTILYAIPRTVFPGLLLVFAYLGAAAAITFKLDNPANPYFFPIVFAFLALLAEYLRNEKVRAIVPFIK